MQLFLIVLSEVLPPIGDVTIDVERPSTGSIKLGARVDQVAGLTG